MEGSLINLLAWMGGVSIYLVIASTVGRAIYSRTEEEFTDDGRIFLSLTGGIFFPVAIPMIILILWVGAMVNIPFKKEEETTESSSKPKKEKEDYVKTKFKVGDLVTGKSGNPGNYQIFYPGCVCRVLEVGRRQVKLKLVDHIDKDANEDEFGRTNWFPMEEFALIKPKKIVKKVAKQQRK